MIYAGCSLNPETDQLRLFLSALKPDGAAVFNLGKGGQQGMYFVADGGRTCELVSVVHFMMAESALTPRRPRRVPLRPDLLCEWIQREVYGSWAEP